MQGACYHGRTMTPTGGGPGRRRKVGAQARMGRVALHLPEAIMDEAQAVADELNVTRAMVLRAAIERGLRAAAAHLRREVAPLPPDPEPPATASVPHTEAN